MSGRALRYLTQPTRSGSLSAGKFRFSPRRRGCRSFPRGCNMTIMAVPLNRLAAGFANRMLERSDALLLWGRSARHMENLFFDDGAVQIVHAVAERDLRERQSHAHPIGGEMVDVIKVNAADGEVPELFHGRSPFDMGEHGGLRRECIRNKAGDAGDLIL